MSEKFSMNIKSFDSNSQTLIVSSNWDIPGKVESPLMAYQISNYPNMSFNAILKEIAKSQYQLYKRELAVEEAKADRDLNSSFKLAVNSTISFNADLLVEPENNYPVSNTEQEVII